MNGATPPPRIHWLGRELVLRLMLPLLAIVVATGALGTYTAQRLTDRVFDRWLLDAAHSLAQLVRFEGHQARIDLPPAAEAMLAYDDADRTYFSVAQGTRLLAGRAGIPVQGSREAQYRRGRAFNAVVQGQRMRVAAVDVEDAAGNVATVLVAETLQKRERTEEDLEAMLWPLAALVLAAAAAIMVAVRRTVQPLQSIAARWNARSHASLEPIEVDEVPRELMPFATALNDLLARIRAMLARERQFAATAAHQLRTPLAGLQLGLARAAEAPDLASARAVLRELNETTQRNARLVQQLLALGRLDPETRGDLSVVETDLVVLAQDVGGAVADLALGKRIELELAAPEQPVMVRVHPELMAEALGNLLDNAIRYTPAGGRVLVQIQSDPPGVSICDSGPGIPDDEREAVFQRFVRGRAAPGDGSGLGLAIVRDIAALHGATVALADSPLGGTCVRLRFSGAGP
jgi:two-component system sensor histidine kinase TctE